MFRQECGLRRVLRLFLLVLLSALIPSAIWADDPPVEEPDTILYLPAISANVVNQDLAGWDEWDVIPGRLIVQFKPAAERRVMSDEVSSASFQGLSLTHIEDQVRQEMVHVGRSEAFVSILPDTYIGIFEPEQRQRILSDLLQHPDVVYVEPDRVLNPVSEWGTAEPNDYNPGTLWGMERIGAPAAWRVQPAQRSAIRVAVMEGGRYRQTHPDLTAQHVAIQHTGVITDHATHVAGIIAATGNNNRDVVGVANVSLVSLHPSDLTSGFVAQVSWAFHNDIRVVNMSFSWRTLCNNLTGGEAQEQCRRNNTCEDIRGHWQYSPASKAQQDAIHGALDRVLFVAAAGNEACTADGNGNIPLPAGYANVIGVSALRQNDQRANFSNFGDYVEMTAPGVSILSTVGSNGTDRMSGTSMAAPHVAGSAAAVLAVKRNFDQRSLRRLLWLTAEDLGAKGRDTDFGHGVVRVDRAIFAIADVYVERRPCFYYIGTGTLGQPYCTNEQWLGNVPNGGTLGFVGGHTYDVPESLSKPMTLIAVGGTVILE